MCENEEWPPPQWVSIASRKHRRAGPRQRKLWERGLVAAQTAEKGESSIYDPNLTEDAIREMEMSCIPTGEDEGRGVELQQKLPHVRKFYRKFDTVIGASQGELTDYILVQWNRDGAVHGYPVTAGYLKSRGAEL